ncbi:MAG: DinB family protein [Chloroflexi bacterium]|nr:DinB family protein [Chloroflexota bacterium]
MIPSEELNPLILSAFTKEITWLEASNRYSLGEFIETFFSTRARTQELLKGLSDSQVAFASDVHPFWSISESITHLIYSQGFYLNTLLDLSTSQLPHVIEAARGFGEGARRNVAAEELRKNLGFATEQIQTAIEGTRHSHDPEKIDNNLFFGACNYRTWVLLLLAHEVDHVRQIAAMRSLARTNA